MKEKRTRCNALHNQANARITKKMKIMIETYETFLTWFNETTYNCTIAKKKTDCF